MVRNNMRPSKAPSSMHSRCCTSLSTLVKYINNNKYSSEKKYSMQFCFVILLRTNPAMMRNTFLILLYEPAAIPPTQY